MQPQQARQFDSHSARPRAGASAASAEPMSEANSGVSEIVVPDEGIEPPTFGLQNRCSTAELIRPGGLHLTAQPERPPYTRTNVGVPPWQLSIARCQKHQGKGEE